MVKLGSLHFILYQETVTVVNSAFQISFDLDQSRPGLGRLNTKLQSPTCKPLDYNCRTAHLACFFRSTSMVGIPATTIIAV